MHVYANRRSPIPVAAPTVATTDRQSLRFDLRQQTADAHARLDASVGSLDTVSDYVRYCRALFRFRAQLEAAIAKAIPNGIDGWQPLAIADLLRSDLADLNASPVTDMDQPPYQLDHGGLLGALYVLEGSSLGAQILVHRATALGFSASHGARHLALQTHDKKRWPGFVAILDREGAANPHAVVEGAQEAFSRALQIFSEDAP